MLLGVSCGRDKTHLPARSYHDMNSYFNGYYNALEIFDEIVKKIETDYDFTGEGFMEINPLGTEQAIKGVIPELEEAIKKNDVVMYKYPNGNWVDDCRFLNGKCWFYKKEYTLAMQNFDEVLNNFPEFQDITEVYLWKARTYYEMDNKEMGLDYFEEFITDDLGLNPNRKFKEEIILFQIKLAMDQGDHPAAIKLLENNIKYINGYGRKARAHFLLAQLYEEAGNFAKSLTRYKAVKRFTNNYDYIFKSKLKVARLLIDNQEGQDESKKIARYLKRMLKDEKNEEFRDQIYFERALLEYKKDSLQLALGDLRRSVNVSSGNNRQKALSYFQAGDIYFKELQEYKNASAYYDSAAQVIPQEAREYKKFHDISKVFKDYVNCIETVQYQDSMLYLASLPKEELDAIVEKVFEAEQKRLAEEEKARQEALAAQAENNNGQGPASNDLYNLNQLREMNNRRNPGLNGAASGWYFDNPSSVTNGKLEFERKWGRRSNEDHWRRKNKTSNFSSSSPETSTASTDSTGSTVDSSLVQQYGDKFKFYQDIPTTAAEEKEANEKIQAALYRLGQIYYETLNETDSSITTYERLLDRYEGSDYAMRARYALFNMYSDMESPLAFAQKSFILAEYPGSIYAKLLQGVPPEEIELPEDEFIYAYEGLFDAYFTGQYITSLGFSEFLLDQYLEEPTLDLAQLHYIRGMSYGYLGLQDSLKQILTQVVNDYPQKEVTEVAKKTLGFLKDLEVENDPGQSNGPLPPAPTSQEIDSTLLENPAYKGFSKQRRANDKLFVLLLLDKEGKDKTFLRDAIKKYVSEEYAEKKLKSFVFDYQRTHFLPYISSFGDEGAALEFIKAFSASTNGKEIIEAAKDPKIFYITQDNFREAYGKKRMEDYVSFYEEVLNK